MKLLEYPDKASLMRKLAQVLEHALAEALEARDQVLFAVPGGTTPGPLFDLLSQASIAW
jgi:6-phosphogluconolactonase